MENMTATVDAKGMLTVKIDTTKRTRLSGSGKSVIIGGTANPAPTFTTPDGTTFTLSVSCYVKAAPAEVAKIELPAAA